MAESGRLYTFGSKENGKLGHGRDFPSSSTGNVTEVTKFYQADEQTLIPHVKIGYVSNEPLGISSVICGGLEVGQWVATSM